MIKITDLPEYAAHEAVLRIEDKETGLRGFIAIHNTNRGPAVGGTRFWYYKNEEEALKDALRLSRAMTYKCAATDLPYGGGKAVLMAPKDQAASHTFKNEKYLQSYARRLELLDGHFFTGEDVGMDEKDIGVLARNSSSIIGRPTIGGLPSPYAASSVFESMRAALTHAYGSDSFVGRTVAIKGLGNVGLELAQMLTKEGAEIIGADVNPEKVAAAQRLLLNCKIVPSHLIHKQKVDIYSPCALGGDLTATVIASLQCSIVCGSANNQLATPKDASRLFARGILYVPDYVANAGGLITVVDELQSGGYDKKRVERNIMQIRETVLHILSESKKKKVSESIIADALAERRFLTTHQ